MSTSLSAQEAIRDTRTGKTIRVVVHTAGAAGPTISDNHWSIYLLLHDGSSVRINMAAEPGYVDGELKWSKQAYQLSNSAIRYWDYEVEGTVRVCDIATLLYNSSRHLYDMSGGGSGCRWWVYVIISDWCTKGWLAKDTAKILWPELHYRYHTRNSRIQLAMVKGTFRPPPRGRN